MDQTVDTVRGSADMWLDCAYESLLEGGVEAVRILPLAKKLNLARTSFYWFFRDRDELLNALVARWEEKNTGNWVTRNEAYADSICEAMLNIFDCWFDDSLFDTRFEAAIRNWAQQSPEITRLIQKDDALRIDVLTATFVRFGYDADVADVRARTTYLTQVGYAAMRAEESFETRMKRIPAFVEVFTGVRPQEHEMQRFYARRNFEG
ncbi:MULTISPECIES: TetR/AcrR family transcriptional regulator [unclassified Caballeronia]|uniref:TetR/AcrR family transcriptional regulator n=1 Tax=unclassified Caballeronia TaxID=2646786 RepID=UPI00285BE415|nr:MULTISPECIES: TetR/AcrR family transcriptional regulator [unclassified Caballeronia]MDR5815591.1 TetR/AcrR family transcriptional regulator [Caballeronia sp. LZ033]MDR5822164.1 TetR/AcrR family transcriptional regulator [Caballeronia sp. LZ043]MDR5836227.1 TetR/AcrR family transcriptional regulator [Caballeronia sp. LZ034LL]MDR5880321.1 TetR/AcrR family transcriptional regulator [Caballeronia sp. LZ032]